MPKVLIVDDVPDNARLLSYCLADEGYQVITASNGPDALRLAEQEYPDAILLDIMMPGMDGFEVLQHLKKDQRLRAVPVLLVTALDDDSDVVRGLTAGADDYITKPFDRSVVVARTRSAVNRHRAYVDKRRLLAELQQLASTDALTGLMNRRAFFDQFHRELKLAQRHNTPLAVAIMDLDFFKRINDEYGHTVGDAALRMVAARIKDHCRSVDLVCRYGGEEFCILLPQTSEEDACSWAERLRRSLATLEVPAGNSHVGITGSIGVAGRWEEMTSPHQMTELADRALLFAKRSGRNRVVSYSSIDKAFAFDDSGQDEAGLPLQGVVARDIMTAPVLTVPGNVPLREAADLLLLSRLNEVPVVDDQGAVVGTVSEKDVLVSCARKDLGEPVGRRMATNVVRFEEDAPAQSVFDFFCRSTVRRVIVTSDHRPVGIISRGTMLRYLLHWDVLKNNEADSSQPALDSGDVVQQQRDLMADTAGMLANALVALREQIAGQDKNADANATVLASRIEELTLDLLSTSDFDPDPTGGWAVGYQPWSV